MNVMFINGPLDGKVRDVKKLAERYYTHGQIPFHVPSYQGSDPDTYTKESIPVHTYELRYVNGRTPVYVYNSENQNAS